MITAAALVERAALEAGRLRVLPPAVPVPLFDTYFALMGARAVMAGVRLRVFDTLADEPADSAAVAAGAALKSHKGV